MSQHVVDRIIGLLLVAVSIYLFYYSNSFPRGADTFPKIMLVVIIVLSLILLGVTFKVKNKINETAKVKGDLLKAIRPYLTFIFCALYVLAVQFIGFFVATIFFGIILMAYLGVRKILPIVISLACLLGVIYLLFVFELNVPLPQGILF